MGDPYRRALDSVTIEMWLQELRMECYRKNLEDYTSLQGVIEFKDVDLKRLGILNAKDRATMIGSLTKYNTSLRFQGFGSKSVTDSQQQPSGKKSSGIKMKKLKGLLGVSSNAHKKNKKGHEVIITSPQLSDDVGLQTIPEIKSRTDDFTQSLPTHQNISSSLENLLGGPHLKCHVVENDYVPDPQSSPLPCHQTLQRSLTISEPQPTRQENTHLTHTTQRPQTVDFDVSFSALASRYNNHFDHLSPHTEEEFDYHQTTLDNFNPNKHLSIVSMESGLGLTCESDDREDFNRTLPLEQQPWFHSSIGRGEAEALLDDDGDFVVHEDLTVKGNYTLSFMWDGRCYHLLINCNEVVMKGPEGSTTGYKYQFDNGAFDSVPELIYNHLRYRIPISSEFDGIIVNPVCRIGTKGLHHHCYIPDFIGKRPYGTLPKNFGRSIDSNLERHVISPDLLNHYSSSTLKSIRSASFSPADSPRQSPSKDFRSSSSSNLLLERDVDDEDEASNQVMASMYKDVPPSPTEHDDIPIEVRPRTISPYSTYDIPIPAANVRRHTVSRFNKANNIDPDDYEVMESVCIRNTLGNSSESSPHSSVELQYSTVVPKTLRHEQTFPVISNNPGVKYAEISFKPCATTSGYSTKADIMARNRAQSVTYVTPRMVREEMASEMQPHPFSVYSQPSNNSRNSPLSSTTVCPPKPNRANSSSSKNVTPTGSPYSSRPASMISRNVRSPQTISDVPGFLKEFTNEEIAMHLTKADAVCFLLAPRPGEDFNLWKNRVNEVSADSGVLVGLEILGSQSGEKLWKKLFYRHLSISQLVIVSLVHIMDTVDRAKMTKRWIEIANLLQSGTYGNLFSFMAVMKGLESPQVFDMKRTWEIIRTHYDETYRLYEDTLKGMISALSEGAAVYAIEQLTVPAIQHLRKLYTDGTTNATSSSQDLRLLLEDFTMRTVGLDGLHSIIAHTSDLSNNAKKRLTVYSYDALLFDFLMQDCARTHLQNMGTSADDPLERYRRFNIVLDALLSKLDNP